MATIKPLNIDRLLENLTVVDTTRIILPDTNFFYPPDYINLETGRIDRGFDQFYNEMLRYPQKTKDLRLLLKQFYGLSLKRQQFLFDLHNGGSNVFLIPEVVEELQELAHFIKRSKRRISKSRKAKRRPNSRIFRDYWKRCFYLADMLHKFTLDLDEGNILQDSFRDQGVYQKLLEYLKHLKVRNEKKRYNRNTQFKKSTDEALVATAFVVSDLYTGESDSGWYPVRILSNDSDIEFLISQSQAFAESLDLRFDIGQIRQNVNGNLEETCSAYSHAA